MTGRMATPLFSASIRRVHQHRTTNLVTAKWRFILKHWIHLSLVLLDKLIVRVKKARSRFHVNGLYNKSGGTYFRTCSTIIGSKRLTTVFGMGTGVTTLICSPEEITPAYSPGVTWSWQRSCLFLVVLFCRWLLLHSKQCCRGSMTTLSRIPLTCQLSSLGHVDPWRSKNSVGKFKCD